MKTKLIIAILCIACYLPSTAQTTFGLRAGVNFQNLNGRDSEGDKVMGKIKTGFNIGANVEIPVGIDFYLQPGLLFSTKGSKADDIPYDTYLSYLEIPVNFIYKPDLGEGRMLLGFGPYVGFAVGGKYKLGSLEEDIEFGGDTDQLKRLDAGANFLAGYEFANKLSFQLNAQLGLGNMINRESGDSDSKLNNTGFGLSLGYRFGGTK